MQGVFLMWLPEVYMKKYDDYTKKALDTLSEIIDDAEDLKIKISAIKELLNITADKKIKPENVEPVIFKGEVED